MKKSLFILLPLMMISTLANCSFGGGEPPEVDTYPVIFNGNGGTLVEGEEFQLVHNPGELVPPTYEHSEYDFAGWDINPEYAVTMMMITAQWKTGEDFTVTFDGGEGATLVEGEKEQTVKSPDQLVPPTYKKDGYVFVMWDHDLDNIWSSVTVKAVWIKEDQYVVYFDGGGEEGKKAELVSGKPVQTFDSLEELKKNIEPPTYKLEGYTFVGWDPDPSTITDKQTIITAKWVPDTSTYTIKWMGGIDGKTELKEPDHLRYGTDLSEYIPKKVDDIETTERIYTFREWDKTPTTVKGDETFTALYDSTLRNYTITWKRQYNGQTEILKEETLPYGTELTSHIPSTDPIVTKDKTYTFREWDKTPTTVKVNDIFTALYDDGKPTQYKITWIDGDGKTELLVSEVDYGAMPSYTGKDPTKTQSDDTVYVFNGKWKDEKGQELHEVDGENTYYSQFKEYKISGCTFKENDDGYVLAKYTGSSSTLDISPIYNGKSVTEIASGAFVNNTTLTSVVVPNSVTSIGSAAFLMCSKLSSITIEATEPPQLEELGILGCDALESIYVPKDSVDTYKSATGWSEYKNIIKAIS